MERAVYERMASLETTHWWFVGRRHVLTRLLQSLKLPQGARILEAGCGMGGNIAMLQRFGEVSAMEPDGPARAHVAERTGVAAVEGFLPDRVPFSPASFDAVCAFDVVEHVDQDAASVAALAERVRPGGYLVVTVPAYQWMWSRHDESHHHKRRYTRPEITAMVRAAGLEVVKSSYFNAVLFPLAAVVRALKRVTGSQVEDDKLPAAPVNAVLGGLFAMEAPAVAAGSLPFGLSIVVVGRRPATHQMGAAA